MIKSFDVTISYDITGSNSFGEKETLVARATKNFRAVDKETAIAEAEFDFRKVGKKVTNISVCERV